MNRVAVLIPAYRASDTVVRCLESLRTQTFKAFDVFLLVDGGDPKFPFAECNEIFQDDANKFWAGSIEHGGVASTRHALLWHARYYEYIAWQDADDESLPDRLTKQVTLLDARTDLVMASTWMREVSGKKIRIIKTPTDPNECRKWYANGRQACLNGAVMFRRAPVTKRVRFQDLKVGSDFVFNLETQREFPLGQSNVPEPLYVYHRQANSLVRAHRAAEKRGEAPSLEQVCAERVRKYGWQEVAA